MPIISFDQANLSGKRVLMRADFDVPLQLGPNGLQIRNDARIRAALPTIDSLIARGARVILLSHLGRPGGDRIQKLSLKPVAERLFALTRRTIYFVEGISDPQSQQTLNSLQNRELALVENIRFWREEEEDNPEFGRALAQLGDIYVNDAFATAHRAHASIVGIPQHLPAFAGLQLAHEVTTLSNLMKVPAHPFVLISGGAKIKDKTEVLQHLAPRVDRVLTGGMMANTLMKAQGVDIKASAYDDTALPQAQELLRHAQQWLSLPVDMVWDADRIMDIGPKTIAQYAAVIAQAKTIFWNGNLGKTEQPPFDNGTNKIAQALSHSKATTVVSGGDTVGAVEHTGFLEKMSFVSMGGGATLEFLAGLPLPGIVALEKNQGGRGLTKSEVTV